MNHDDIIRVLDLIDNPLLNPNMKFKDRNLPHFAFAEYLQNASGARVSTDRIFQVKDVTDHIDVGHCIHKMSTAQMELNKATNTEIYQFRFMKDCNLQSSRYSNCKTPNLAITISGEMQSKNENDEQLKELQEYIQKQILYINQISKIRQKEQTYRLERRNKYVKKPIIIALTVGGVLAATVASYHFIDEQQRQKRLEQMQNLDEILQQPINPEEEKINAFLENIRLEHEEQKKLP